jgi:hypothetical protein
VKFTVQEKEKIKDLKAKHAANPQINKNKPQKTPREKWLKKVKVISYILRHSNEPERRKLGREIRKLMKTKEIMPAQISRILGLINLDNQEYKGNITKEDREKLKGFSSHIESMRKKHLTGFPPSK